MKSRKIALEPCIYAGFRGKPAVGRARLELATNALKGRSFTYEVVFCWLPVGTFNAQGAV